MFIWKESGLDPIKVHEKLCTNRRKEKRPEPDLTTVRRALRGMTFKRGRSETRGRKRALSAKNLKTLDATRKRLIEKAQSDYEVAWDDVVKSSRVPRVHRTTAAKSLIAAGYDIRARTPRRKPCRTEIDEAERKRICNALRKKPVSYWQRDVVLYVDNKTWQAPVSAKGKKYLNSQKVRWHLRLRCRLEL